MQSQGQPTDMRPGSSLLLLPGVVTEANGGGPHFSIEGGWYCWSVPLISPVLNPEDQYVAAPDEGARLGSGGGVASADPMLPSAARGRSALSRDRGSAGYFFGHGFRLSRRGTG